MKIVKSFNTIFMFLLFFNSNKVSFHSGLICTNLYLPAQKNNVASTMKIPGTANAIVGE